MPAICADNLGLFLFLKYCSANGDLPAALFIESVSKFKMLTSEKARASVFVDLKRTFAPSAEDVDLPPTAESASPPVRLPHAV